MLPKASWESGHRLCAVRHAGGERPVICLSIFRRAHRIERFARDDVIRARNGVDRGRFEAGWCALGAHVLPW